MPLPRGRRYAVRGLLIAATVLAVAAIFAVWAGRQVLDADNWADTSTALLQDPAIRTEVSTFLVDELYSDVDVAAELSSALPPRLQPLAGPAAGGLRSLADRAAYTALGRPRVEDLWRTANRATARQLIAIAEGKSKAVTASGGAVVLDLRVVLLDVVERVGLPGTLSSKIPPGAGRIKIMSDSQVDTIQNAATLLRVLAVALPLLAFALLAGAVALARGRRRTTLLECGVALVVAGLVTLLVRNLAGGYVVDQLATTDAVRPAAEQAWAISTRLLRDVAQATVICGLPLIAAAWLAGPSRPAFALRRAMAPWLRERPAVSYAAAVVLALLIVWWEPIPATRKPLPMLVMTVLLLVGVAVLRRQTAEEFPGATVAGAHAALHERAARLRAGLGRLRRQPAPVGAAAAPGAAAAAPGAAAGSPAPEAGAAPVSPAPSDPLAARLALERLAALHAGGALTDAEFAEEKARLNDRGHVGTSP